MRRFLRPLAIVLAVLFIVPAGNAFAARRAGYRQGCRRLTGLAHALAHRLPILHRGAYIAKHLLEGCGIRKTSRLVGASKSGVTSVALRIGWHAYALHDERARGLTVN